MMRCLLVFFVFSICLMSVNTMYNCSKIYYGYESFNIEKSAFKKYLNHTSRSYVCDGYCIFCNQNLNLDKTIKSDHKRDGKEHYRFDLKFWHFAEDTSDCYMIHLKALNENQFGIHWTLKHSNYWNVLSSLKCVTNSSVGLLNDFTWSNDKKCARTRRCVEGYIPNEEFTEDPFLTYKTHIRPDMPGVWNFHKFSSCF